MLRAVRGLSFVLLLGTSWLSGSHPAAGQRGGRIAVAIGDTGAYVGGAPAAESLEEALHASIAARPDLREEGRIERARFIVTGSVTELSARNVGSEHEVHVTVSIVVADRGGSVRAMLRGRAGATGDDRDSLTEAALRAAVRSAIRPIGDSLR